MSISSINSPSIRLSGLSSGLDTDSIVKELLNIEQTKIDNQFKQKQVLEWKLDAYREVKTGLKAFTQKYMSVLSEDNLWSSSALKVNNVDYLDENKGIITIEAGPNASAGNMVVNEITSLAKGANVEGSTGIATGEGITNYNTYLSDLNLATPIDFSSGEVSFEINGQAFNFYEDDTLQDMMDTINNDNAANVKLSYSQLTNSFKLESRDMGSDSELVIYNFTGNMFSSGTSALGIDEGTYSNGQNATLKINGIDVERDSNSFVIDGIQYNLQSTTASSISFTISQDVDTVVDKISSFVDDYNALIEKYNGKITEDKYFDYSPLTDEQKEEMSDSEIESWEEKAKSGLLRSDNDISSMLSQFRLAFTSVVEGTGMSLADIGLKTGSYTNNGKIELDKDTLEKAIISNPDRIVQLFTQSSTATGATKTAESGLMQRMNDTINTYISDIQTISVDSTERKISDIEDKMDSLERLMEENEERYYAQFTAMEQALATMNAQSQWLANMLSNSY